MRDLRGTDCIGYIRVSTEKQAGEVQTSPEDQRAAITALASKLGRTVGDWFVDPGYSGATYDKRPGFKELVESCEASPRKQGGLVLALNDSRWGRFPDVEEGTYWRFHLARVGWVVRFAEQDDVDDKILRPILRAMVQGQATSYRDNIRANAKRGARGTAEQGFWTTRAPYGYRRMVVHPMGRERVLETGVRKAADEKVKLTPHDAEARIVREAFERYATGRESGASLTAWLRTVDPSHVWSKPGVMHLLQNPAYMGDVQLGRRLHSGDGKQRDGAWRRPTDEWFGKRDAHEAIVPRDLFARVQRRLAGNAKQARGTVHYVLSGLLACAHCGAPLIGGGVGSHLVNGERQRFYRCGSIERRIPCPGKLGCVSKHRLEGAVLDTVTRELTRPGAIRELRRAFDRQWARLHATPQPDRVGLQRALKALQQQQARLVASIASGVVTEAEARTQMQQVRAELKTTEDALALAASQAVPAGLSTAERDRLVEAAVAFPALAPRLSGADLRDLVAPWLAGGTFDKSTRVLTLHLRRIPTSILAPSALGLADSPEQTRQPQAGTVTRRVALTVGRSGWVALEAGV